MRVLNLGSKFSHQESWEKSIYEVYKDAEVPLNWSEELVKHCQKKKSHFSQHRTI